MLIGDIFDRIQRTVEKTGFLIIILLCAIACVRLSAYAQDAGEANVHENVAPALSFGLINPERTYAGVGQTETIKIQVCDNNGKKAAGVRVRFSASGPAIIDEQVTADENGIASAQLVIGKEYPGDYYITVTSEEPGDSSAASMLFFVHLDSDGDGMRDGQDCWPMDPDFQSCRCEIPGPARGDTLSMYVIEPNIDKSWAQNVSGNDGSGDPQACFRIPSDIYQNNIDAILREISASLDIKGHEKSVERLTVLGPDATPYLINRLTDYEHPDIIADALWVIADVERIPDLIDYLDSIDTLSGREYEVEKVLRLFDKFDDTLNRMLFGNNQIIQFFIGERESEILYELFLKSDGYDAINELLEGLLCRYGIGEPKDKIYQYIKGKYHIDNSAFYCP